MTKLKVAVLGAGILGSRHARVFAEHPDCETAAVIDINEARALDVAGRVGARAFSSLDRAWQEIDFDALAVVTPDHVHRDPVVEAIRRDKHVFAEKPLATTPADAEAIVAASESAKVTVMINFSQRYAPEYAAIKRLIDNGDIGTPAMVTSHKFDTVSVPTRMIGWSASTSPFLFMSSHDLDLVRWYVGADPTEVLARDRRGVLDAAGVAVHDGINVLLQFGEAIAGNFHASWIHPETYPAVADGFLQVIGTHGVVNLDNRRRRLEVFGRKGSYEQVFSGAHTANEVDGRLVGAFADSVDAFVTCVREGREPDTSPRRCLPVAKAQFAAMQALQTGGPVSIG